MKHIKRIPSPRFVLLTLTLLVALIVIASNVRVGYAKSNAAPHLAPGYTIDWYTMDGGGAMNLQGGSYTLSGTIGQPDAGTISGGNYKIDGGFWGFFDSLRSVFLPLIMR